MFSRPRATLAMFLSLKSSPNRSCHHTCCVWYFSCLLRFYSASFHAIQCLLIVICSFLFASWCPIRQYFRCCEHESSLDSLSYSCLLLASLSTFLLASMSSRASLTSIKGLAKPPISSPSTPEALPVHCYSCRTSVANACIGLEQLTR